MNPLYSVVVPARNQGEPLPLLMRCLEAQTLAPDKFECVVVDDASTDGTGAFLRGYRAGFELRTVTNRQGRGRSLSRDRGWRDARGEFVVFLDADMLPEPGWLEAFDRAFTGGGFDIVAGGRYHVTVDEGRGLAPQLAELAGRDVDELFAGEDPEGARALRARARPGQYAHPIFGQLEGQLPPLGLAYPKSLLNAYSFNAANTAVRRSYLERSTGFNPYLLRFEDIELGIRLWELGARFGGAEGARAYHLSRREPAEPWFDYAEGRALFCRHPYRLVALMNLWGSYQSSGGSDAPPGCFDSLLNLLRSDGEGLPFDLCEEYMRVYRQPLPVDFHVSKEAMVNFYTAGNPLWTRESAAGVFDLAVEHGLFVGRKGSEVYFDFMHTGNWVRDCTSSLQDWLTKYILTGTKSPFLLSLKHSDLLSLRCVGKYEVTFPSEWFEGEGAQATLNLPLPVEHASQTGVKITRCFPESLSAYVGRSRGMVIGFPVGRGEGDLVRVGYEFECRVDEFAPPERSTPPRETPDLSRHLRPAMPAPYLAKAEALLRHVIPEGVTDPFETARALYVWLQHSVVFNETPFSYPYYLILDTGFGPCIQQTRLFINLCRILKIPAREQCGALLPYDISSSAPQTDSVTLHGVTPFIHTWAEFYDPARGWIPVEVHGFGAKTVTGLNLPDQDKREKLKVIYDEVDQPYHFGSMHPCRVVTSEQANRAPVYPVFRPGALSKAPPEMQLEVATRLVNKLSYTLTRLS